MEGDVDLKTLSFANGNELNRRTSTKDHILQYRRDGGNKVVDLGVSLGYCKLICGICGIDLNFFYNSQLVYSYGICYPKLPV